MKYGKITAETNRMIGGLNAVISTNAGGSLVIEIPYAPDDNVNELCAALYQTLGERGELFPERKKHVTDDEVAAIWETLKKRATTQKPYPYDLTAHALDGSHYHKVRIASGTDWLQCNCGSVLFSVAFAEFADYSDGVVAQCQECGQLLEIQKD